MKQSVGVVSKKLFKYVRSVAGGGAAFVVVDKGFVYKAVAAGSGVVAGEVPVSGVVRYRLVHRLHRLEYYLDFGASASGVRSSAIFAATSSSVKGAYISLT